jgi:hypothetical protein
MTEYIGPIQQRTSKNFVDHVQGFFFISSTQSDLHWNDEGSYIHENE